HAAPTPAPARPSRRGIAGVPESEQGCGAGSFQHGLDRHRAVAAGRRRLECHGAGRRAGEIRTAAGAAAELVGSEPMSWHPAATRAMLEGRARLLAQARRFFGERGLLEVDTPIVVNAAVTDVHIHSARVHFEPYSSNAPVSEPRAFFLHTSPEYA